jgi:hypothetical protein
MGETVKPKIDRTKFGSITIEGRDFDFDIVIGIGGKVTKRKKKLSKEIYGTSHILSLPEIKHIFKKEAQHLIIGSGQSGMVKLSDEAKKYLQGKGCQVELLPTPQAIKAWNRAKGQAIGLFHITC